MHWSENNGVMMIEHQYKHPYNFEKACQTHNFTLWYTHVKGTQLHPCVDIRLSSITYDHEQSVDNKTNLQTNKNLWWEYRYELINLKNTVFENNNELRRVLTTK